MLQSLLLLCQVLDSGVGWTSASLTGLQAGSVRWTSGELGSHLAYSGLGNASVSRSHCNVSSCHLFNYICLALGLHLLALPLVRRVTSLILAHLFHDVVWQLGACPSCALGTCTMDQLILQTLVEPLILHIVSRGRILHHALKRGVTCSGVPRVRFCTRCDGRCIVSLVAINVAHETRQT